MINILMILVIVLIVSMLMFIDDLILLCFDRLFLLILIIYVFRVNLLSIILWRFYVE
jgi:hypothetical protein